MHRAAIRMRSALALVLVLVSCAGPEPSATPSPSASLTEVGDGTVLESEWRYAVGEADGGWCIRLDVAQTSASRCGDLLPSDERAFGELGHGPDAYTDAQVVEGFVTADVATVWLIGQRAQYRIPAVLMPLDEVGLEGAQAYVGFAQADVTLTHVQGLALNGEVLETIEGP